MNWRGMINSHEMNGKRMYRVGLAVVVALFLSACSQEVPAHLRPLSKDAMHLLGKKGMSTNAPIFIRIYKEESELEVWKQRSDGRFYHFKSYPICNWSGDLGPKLQQGDKQAPEGFYTVAKYQMNPNSSFHLSFNLGFPNTYDKAHGRNGQFLMVHGDCRSAGCYAMTDALIEEIYALAREAFAGGQEKFTVHAYPFRMTDAKMREHRTHKWYPFWVQLKEGYDYFELTRQPPEVQVCSKRYLVNAKFIAGDIRVDPASPCPAYQRPAVQPFVPFDPVQQQLAMERITVPGKKTRNLAEERRMALTGGAGPFSPPPSGLTKVPRAPGGSSSTQSLFDFGLSLKSGKPKSFSYDDAIGLND